MTWLCRKGWHLWRRRNVAAQVHTGLASVTYRCARPGCIATRHEQHVTAPTAQPSARG